MLKTFFCIVFAILLVGCSPDNRPEPKSLEPRFEVLEQFKAFDDSELPSRFIRDTTSGKCYLWIIGVSGYGVGVVEISCQDKSKDVFSRYEELRQREIRGL